MSRVNVGKAGGDLGSRGRFSSKKKLQAVLRLLQGESLDTLSRELKVNAGALNASLVALKFKPSDGRDVEIKELKTLIGDLTPIA